MTPGQTIYISDNPELAGKYDNLFVIDSPKFAAKLRQGDKMTLNYGTVELSVTSFISPQAYFENHS